jgi:hypothetical protein
MKKLLLICYLFTGFSVLTHAQTVIRFVPDKSLRNTDNQTIRSGVIKQTGNDFSHEVQIELPDRKLRLQFRPSPIKQYNKIYTSTGEKASQAELYEAVTDKKRYYLTTINRQFHGLFLSEEGNYSSIDPSNNAFYTYQKIKPIESIGNRCSVDSLIKTININTVRLKSSAMPACLEFPVAFVCDYMHYLFSNFDIAKVEADNLMRLATTQEIFSPYAFKAEISFKAIGNVIYTNQESSPWTTEVTRGLGDAATDLQFSWIKPDEWKKRKSLIVVGLTGINFQGTLPGYGSLWGYTKAIHNEFGMGSFIIKGSLGYNESRWIFAHEMGHIFGAQHDSDSKYLMFQNYSTTLWSAFSKESINGILDELNLKNLLRECSRVILTYEIEKDSLAFAWQTNYDDLADSFIIEYSSDEQKTWGEISKKAAKGVYNYQFRFISKVPLGDVTYYRVRQEGTNQIVSNVLRISITSTETLEETIKVFPNPFSNQVTIELLTPARINVFAIDGKRLLSSSAQQTKHTIDTSSWPAGVYFVQVDNNLKVYKIVK